MPRTAAKTTKTTATSRKAPARGKNATAKAKVAAAPVFPAQPINLPKFRAGQDYQVSNPRTINGRLYQAGEILDQTGLDQKHIELLRDQRIIIDIPVGTEPPLPIPASEPAPMTSEERKAMRDGDAIGSDAPPVGKVFPKYTGFSKWHVVDSRGQKVAGPYEGTNPKNDAQKEANRRNREAGIEVTAEEEMIASRQDHDEDEAI